MLYVAHSKVNGIRKTKKEKRAFIFSFLEKKEVYFKGIKAKKRKIYFKRNKRILAGKLLK